jgi:hypothetical protein
VKDYRTIAAASGILASEPELERIATTLDKLEEAFRPLMRDLSPDLDPASGFSAEEEAE